MKGITFGRLLEKLLYLSNQKKSTLAKELGYDISYISKWINEKNLPTQKSVSGICKLSSEFIVKDLTYLSKQELKNYFEIDIENDKVLTQYIERSLKEAYINTAKKSIPNIYKGTHSEDNYNSITHINPSLRKSYLSKDTGMFVNKSENMDIIISANLYSLNKDDKMAIANMKEVLFKMQEHSAVRARILMGFDNSNEYELVFNTILLLNMISTYPTLDFKIYHCEINPDTIISVIKDRIFHSAILNKEGRSLFTNMSKEKNIVEEMYYSLDDTIKNRGKLIVKNKTPREIIKEKDYVHFIMGQNLRFLISSINEFFMPMDLFKEIARLVFGEDEEILSELSQINTFLHKVTYESKIKVLIYEEELKKYISTGELNFFNIPIKLNFKQVEMHMNYIKTMIEKNDKIDVRLIDGNFIENMKKNWHPSMYLSKSLKLTKVNPVDSNDYLIIKDNDFKSICDKLFDYMWEKREDIVVKDREDINERIEKMLAYTKIVNNDFNL